MMYHNNNNNENSSSSFSMLFAMPKPYDHNEEPAEMYSFASSSSSSSSVDCTLSLGTPSTRLSNHDNEKIRRSSCISNFCWDIFNSKNSSSSSSGHYKSSRGNNGGGGGETLLARRCANCDTTSTPLWRNGPKGPKSLCNACGIRFKKEERRASAAAATHAAGGGGGAGAGGGIDGQDMLNSTSWGGAAVHGQNHQQKVPYISSAYGNEFRFIEDDHDRDSSHFLSWRLNVTDRPAGIVHEFTR